MLKESIKNLFIGIARTASPILAGSIMAFFASMGLDLPAEYQAEVTAILFALMTLLYYIIVALLERYVNPKFGWLFGVAKKPEYIQTVSDNVGTLSQPTKPVQSELQTLSHEEGRAG